MIYKLRELDIDKANPFKNCKLDRLQYANILTRVVSQSEGCVLAIDGKWGSGKTTFVKMWQQSLKNGGFDVLYFNVWEEDFTTDPIIGLVSQFQNISSKEKTRATFENIKTTAGKIVTGMLPAIIKGLAYKYLGKEVSEVLKSEAHPSVDIFDKLIDKYIDQSQSIKEFRKSLERLVATTTEDGKPLIFIIDELDRCNPHFAVKVLERVKHLFNVPNIVFVLSIDKTQLCHSICGYYGSDNFDAKEYLKRFIDIEYKLPEPNVAKFLDYLYEEYNFGDFFDSKSRLKFHKLIKEKEDFTKTASFLFKQLKLNLRQMEKIYAHIRLTLLTFEEGQYTNPSIILMLVYFRAINERFYNQIVNKCLTAQELLNSIENALPSTIFTEKEYNEYPYSRYAIFEISKLIVSYNLEDYNRERERLVQETTPNGNTNENAELSISPQIIPPDTLLEAIKYHRNFPFHDHHTIPLSNIIQHIELLEGFRQQKD